MPDLVSAVLALLDRATPVAAGASHATTVADLTVYFRRSHTDRPHVFLGRLLAEGSG